ncbi:hypothetical protein BC936DRAFT_147634 [Jimgerdemannia flammicorona]|uniref:Uncharacterized protein n=1 Tax=Jimgerdemannia flammicorona TaxID=994334 RepID=A0A433D4W8_9FUNG|nr:hypothetical protein BC936DRAFT_147634 [Jimgerdemannia flammicorona]
MLPLVPALVHEKVDHILDLAAPRRALGSPQSRRGHGLSRLSVPVLGRLVPPLLVPLPEALDVRRRGAPVLHKRVRRYGRGHLGVRTGISQARIAPLQEPLRHRRLLHLNGNLFFHHIGGDLGFDVREFLREHGGLGDLLLDDSSGGGSSGLFLDDFSLRVHGHGLLLHGHGLLLHGHGLLLHGHGLLLHGHGLLLHGHGLLLHGHGLLLYGRGFLLHGHGLLLHNDGLLLHNDGLLLHNDGLLLHNNGLLNSDRGRGRGRGRGCGGLGFGFLLARGCGGPGADLLGRGGQGRGRRPLFRVYDRDHVGRCSADGGDESRTLGGVGNSGRGGLALYIYV